MQKGSTFANLACLYDQKLIKLKLIRIQTVPGSPLVIAFLYWILKYTVSFYFGKSTAGHLDCFFPGISCWV